MDVKRMSVGRRWRKGSPVASPGNADWAAVWETVQKALQKLLCGPGAPLCVHPREGNQHLE